MASAPEPTWEAVKEILGYFLRNPQAVDGVEGIARWRVMEEQVHRSVEQTEIALRWLLSEGYLQEVETIGTRHIFRLSADRQESATRLLEGRGLPRRKTGFDAELHTPDGKKG
jgi:hypothetical protein